jgi:acid phosphatase type 7
MKKLVFVSFLFCFVFKINSQTTLFPYSTPWKYLDDGSNQATAWQAGTFNDASWVSGNAELGYGDLDETTVVSYGPNSSLKYITTYFRKTINIPNASTFAQFALNFRRDDGVVIYVNGTEVNRDNMPTGTIAFNTLASSAASDDGNTVITQNLPTGTFTNGNNVIAVEIHQSGPTSSDITWTAELLGITSLPPANLVKGPYLQIGTPTSMIVRWETDIASDTKVAYGTSSTALTSTVGNPSSLTSHSVLITGLSPYTKYYYSVGTTSAVIQSGADNYFVTSPLPDTEAKYRFWVTGDCGNNSTNQTNCKNAYNTFNGSTITDGWLLLGDNAYSNGTNSEFDTKFFNIYETDIMKKAVLWPAPGNHDYNNGATTNTTVPYYSIFSTPINGQAGGLASGTPAYYSYDYGNIHFISLDSYGTVASKKMYDTTGAQAIWLKNDLAANTKRWIVAYWHHPPYTMGSHNSDLEFFDLGEVRSKFIRILERYKVDLIMCGHSHDYERSKLMKGHYGLENTFNATTHNSSTSSGLYDGTANSCPYEKDSVFQKTGTVYVVSGSAGQLGGTAGSFPHNAMHYSNATNGGSLVLDFEANRLDAKWLGSDGVIRDKFTMFKDVGVVKSMTIAPGQSTTLTASWPGNFTWNNSASTNSIIVNPTVATTYWVKDPNTCVADTFKIYMNIFTGIDNAVNGINNSINIYPNPNNGSFVIDMAENKNSNIEVVNGVGQLIYAAKLTNGANAIDLKTKPGIYFYRILNDEKTTHSGKIIIQK